MHDGTLLFPRLQVLTLPCREFHSLFFITANMKKKPISVKTLSLCHHKKTATFSTLVVSCNQNNTPAPSLLPWVFPLPSETSQQSKALDKVTLKWNFTEYKHMNMWNSISYACIQQKTKFTAATRWKAKQQMRDPTIINPVTICCISKQARIEWDSGCIIDISLLVTNCRITNLLWGIWLLGHLLASDINLQK
jgi:hypothetical protein